MKSTNILLGLVALLISFSSLSQFENDVFTQFGTNWMSHVDQNKKLNELSIPGTHNSGAIVSEASTNNINSNLGNTQNKSIRQQLDMGVRYIDVQLKTVELFPGTPVRFVHSNGALYLEDFDEIVLRCRQFLEDNPSETILMAVSNLGNDNAAFTTYMNLEFLQIDFQTLGGVAHPFYANGSHLTTFPTVGQAKGKIVLINRYSNSSSTPGIKAVSSSWGNNDNFTISSRFRVQDKHIPINIEHKILDINDMITYSRTSGSSSRMHINDCSAAAWYLTPINAANLINFRVYNHIKNRTWQRIGTILMDFMEPKHARAIYMSNFDVAVTLYEHENYVHSLHNGKHVHLRAVPGSWTEYKRIPLIGGNKTSSMKVHGSTWASAYDFVHFSGPYRFVNSNQPKLSDLNWVSSSSDLDDDMSSIKILYFGSGGLKNLQIDETEDEIDAQLAAGSSVAVFPNPAKEFCNLVLQNESFAQKAVVSVVDMNGRIVRTSNEELVEGKNILNYSTLELKSGTYKIIAKLENGEVLSKTLMIE